jgi:nucleoside-diphosphate-sugar epimerase
MSQPTPRRRALIAGVSGIVGGNLARRLLRSGWDVYGIARRAPTDADLAGVVAVAVDLTAGAGAVRDALTAAALPADDVPLRVFYATWSRQPSEAANIRVNVAMLTALLDALAAGRWRPAHVSLVTGLKHYLGPFESYATALGGGGGAPELPTPFREDQPRLPVPNFYYDQEDALLAAAARDGLTWSVHRPHTVVGWAHGGAMNLGVTLAVVASLCKAAGRPFAFPGSAAQWHGLTDVTDAGQLAAHLEWAATTPACAGAALNVVNGDVFRWRWMWRRLADWFGVEAAPPPAGAAGGVPLEAQLAQFDAAGEWRMLAARHALAEPDIHKLISAWHTDADLGRPLECVTDMGRSRALGFTEYAASDAAFAALFEQLRARRVIPP